MQNRMVSRGWMRARTLYLMFAIAAYLFSRLSSVVFSYMIAFVMTPWTVLLLGHSVAHRQVRWNAYNILLFVMIGIYTAAALRNQHLSVRGLGVLALGFVTVWTGVRAFGRFDDSTPQPGWLKLCFFILAAALAVLLAAVLCDFFGRSDLLPWVTRKAVTRSARGSSHSDLLQRRQYHVLKIMGNLLYVSGAMLVAGIVPKDADAASLKRETRAICLFTTPLILGFLAPAVLTVFSGRPIAVSLVSHKVGIQSPGLVTDRIWAFQHPNNTALWAVIGIFCAIYCLHGETRRWLKVLLGLEIAILLMALAHSQSRTNDIALGVGAGAMVFHRIYLRFAGRRWRLPVGTLAWGLTVVLAILLVSGLYTADVMVATRMGAAAENNLLDRLRQSAEDKKELNSRVTTPSDQPVEVADGVVVPRTVSAGMFNVFSNGRDKIWRDTVDYLIHHPSDMLFGMGPGSIMERFKAYNPDRYRSGYLHNGYLEALVRGGAFMLIALLCALCLLIKPAARLLVSEDAGEPGKYFLAVFIGVPLMIAMVEVILFSTATMYNVLFFYAAGRAIHERDRETVPAN